MIYFYLNVSCEKGRQRSDKGYVEITSKQEYHIFVLAIVVTLHSSNVLQENPEERCFVSTSTIKNENGLKNVIQDDMTWLLSLMIGILHRTPVHSLVSSLSDLISTSTLRSLSLSVD